MRRPRVTRLRALGATLGVAVLSVGGTQISLGASPTTQPIPPSISVPPTAPSPGPAPPTVAGAKPFMNGYQAPTGPLVGVQAVLAIAPTAAKNAGDPAATGIAAVQTTVAKGLAAMSPNYQGPTGASPGLAAYMNNPAYLVVMHGHFALPTSSLPSGGTHPTGTVLEVLIDAHSGHAESLSLSKAVATPLSRLGAVTALP